MSSEVFDGPVLEESIRLLHEYQEVLNDVIEDSSDLDVSVDSDDGQNVGVESLRRVHLGGAAAKVTPLTDLEDCLHFGLVRNLSTILDSGRVPFLVQHLTPLLMAEYDTLVLAPPGRSQIEALLIPIINKILFSLVDGARMERKPRAVILSSNHHEREKIEEVMKRLTLNLPIACTAHNTIDKLMQYFDFESDHGMIDILITTPQAYIAFTKRTTLKREGEVTTRRYPSKILLDRLQYLVIFELEECCDGHGDYSQIIANHRRENEFTLVIQTHTYFSNRGGKRSDFNAVSKKYFSFDYAEKRNKLENLLKKDYGLVMVDSTVCISNIFVLNDNELAKMRHLKSILEQHHASHYRSAEDRNGGLYKYEKRLLIVVSNAARARMLLAFLTSGGRYHQALIDPKHILHLERELEYREGFWSDPLKKFRTGQLLGVITHNIFNVRMGHSIVDKIIFFDVVPNLHTLVLNCSKIVDNRRSIFLLTKSDLRTKRRDLQSLVQYLKDVDSAIPDYLKQFETVPTSVKSIFK